MYGITTMLKLKTNDKALIPVSAFVDRQTHNQKLIPQQQQQQQQSQHQHQHQAENTKTIEAQINKESACVNFDETTNLSWQFLDQVSTLDKELRSEVRIDKSALSLQNSPYDCQLTSKCMNSEPKTTTATLKTKATTTITTKNLATISNVDDTNLTVYVENEDCFHSIGCVDLIDGLLQQRQQQQQQHEEGQSHKPRRTQEEEKTIPPTRLCMQTQKHKTIIPDAINDLLKENEISSQPILTTTTKTTPTPINQSFETQEFQFTTPTATFRRKKEHQLQQAQQQQQRQQQQQEQEPQQQFLPRDQPQQEQQQQHHLQALCNFKEFNRQAQENTQQNLLYVKQQQQLEPPSRAWQSQLSLNRNATQEQPTLEMSGNSGDVKYDNSNKPSTTAAAAAAAAAASTLAAETATATGRQQAANQAGDAEYGKANKSRTLPTIARQQQQQQQHQHHYSPTADGTTGRRDRAKHAIFDNETVTLPIRQQPQQHHQQQQQPQQQQQQHRNKGNTKSGATKKKVRMAIDGGGNGNGSGNGNGNGKSRKSNSNRHGHASIATRARGTATGSAMTSNSGGTGLGGVGVGGGSGSGNGTGESRNGVGGFVDGIERYLGLVGWRKKCLYTLLLLLMLLIITNLVLTFWILKVMEFSTDGMGQLKIIPGGIQLSGQAIVMDMLRASTIRSRHGQPISIESSRNFSINTRDPNGVLENHLFLGHDKLECLSAGFRINDTNGRNLFSVNRNEVTIGAHALRIDGEGGAIFRESIQTPHVRAEPGRELRLESPTRQLELTAAKDINLQSRAGNIELLALEDVKLSALDGSLRLESSKILMPNLRTAQPPIPGTAQNHDHLHRVFQLCACANGKLFLAAPHSICAGDDSTVCR